jgi:outer membrane protein
MRKSGIRLVLFLALVAGTNAFAQFANKRIGFELGGLSFTDRELTFGLAAQLEGNIYIENGFDVGLRVPFILFFTRGSETKQEFGTGGQLYVRYLFSEESLRPYVSVQLDVLVVIRGQVMGDMSANQIVFWGPGAALGLDYFVGDSVSIGARGFFTLYIALNNDQPIRPSGGGYANIAFYF